jgi:hypothetical protein
MDFLKMTECQSDMPNCPSFKNDCCPFDVYENPQTGVMSVIQQGGNPGPNQVFVDGDMCCEDAALLAGLTLGCMQLDLTSLPGVRVIRTGTGWRSLAGPVSIPTNPPFVVPRLTVDPSDPGDPPPISNEDEPGWIEIEDPELPPEEITDLPGLEDIPEDGGPIDQPEGPATGTRWILESVTPSHTKFPAGWNYSSGSATGTIYNGDRFQITWTPPPQQIDSNGFNMSLNVQATAAGPKNAIAGLVSVSSSGLDSDTPSDQRQAYATGTGNASASKSMHFKPVQNAYTVEVKVGVMWEVSYTYAYRRAD